MITSLVLCYLLQRIVPRTVRVMEACDRCRRQECACDREQPETRRAA